jgi:hypothetical protein
MTSQTVYLDAMINGAYQRVGTFTRAADVTLSKLIYPTVTTGQIRLLQPASKGPPTYAGILWVAEVFIGNGIGP